MENKRTLRELQEWINILISHSVITAVDGNQIIHYSELPENKENIVYNREMKSPEEVFNTFYWDTTDEGLEYWEALANNVTASFSTRALTLLANLYSLVLVPDYQFTLQAAKSFGKNNGFEVDVMDIDLLVACHLLYIVEDYELGIFLRIFPQDVFLINEALRIVTTKIPDYVIG